MGRVIETGGVGMWVLIAYGAAVLPLIWGYGIVQLVALIRWKSRLSEMGKLVSGKDASALLGHLGEKAGKEAMAGVISAAARSVLDGEAPEAVLEGTRAELDRRMPVVSPPRAVLAMICLSLAAPAPLALGAMFRSMGIVRSWGWILEGGPAERCDLLSLAITRASHPFWLGVIVCSLLAVPALVGVFMELTVLRARRRRDDVLGLVTRLLGLDPRPGERGGTGILAFVLAALLCGGAGWLLTGPPVVDLAATRLHGSCVHGLEGRSVRIPSNARAKRAEDLGLKLFVKTEEIFLEVEHLPGFGDLPRKIPYSVKDVRVTDLVDGRPGVALGEDGVTIEPLARLLRDIEPERADDCSLLDGCDPTVDAVLVVMDAAVPLETAAAVLVTARRSQGRDVSVLVRTSEPEPRSFASLLAEVKGFASMKCVKHCEYGMITVGDPVADPAGSGKPVLDGKSKGTFGGFVEGLAVDAFDILVR